MAYVEFGNHEPDSSWQMLVRAQLGVSVYVAFGIVALSLTFVVEDGVGGSDLLEANANKLANVASVEIVSVDRL